MGKKKIKPERILQELASIGFAKATDFLEIQDRELMVRPTQQLSKDDCAAIASVEKTSNGIRLKFYDKMKALELLGKHMGLFEGKENGENKVENNLLEAILEATQEDMDTDDIPEIQQTANPCDDLVEPSDS